MKQFNARSNRAICVNTSLSKLFDPIVCWRALNFGYQNPNPYPTLAYPMLKRSSLPKSAHRCAQNRTLQNLKAHMTEPKRTQWCAFVSSDVRFWAQWCGLLGTVMCGFFTLEHVRWDHVRIAPWLSWIWTILWIGDGGRKHRAYGLLRASSSAGPVAAWARRFGL